MNILDEVDQALINGAPLRREKAKELVQAFRDYQTQTEARLAAIIATGATAPAEPIIPESQLWNIPPQVARATQLAGAPIQGSLRNIIELAELYIAKVHQNMLLDPYLAELEVKLSRAMELAKHHL